MSICGGIVDFEASCCVPQVVVDFVSCVVYAFHVVVLVAGRENDDFVGIVCHSSGLGIDCCSKFATRLKCSNRHRSKSI